MLSLGMDPDIISRVTELSLEELAKLKTTLQSAKAEKATKKR
jgi:hypothetical protein